MKWINGSSSYPLHIFPGWIIHICLFWLLSPSLCCLSMGGTMKTWGNHRLGKIFKYLQILFTGLAGNALTKKKCNVGIFFCCYLWQELITLQLKIKASTFCFFHSASTVATVALGRNYCTNATEINPHNRHNWTKVTKFTMQLNNATLIKLLYTTYFTIFRAYYYPHPKTFLFSFFSMYFG